MARARRGVDAGVATNRPTAARPRARGARDTQRGARRRCWEKGSPRRRFSRRSLQCGQCLPPRPFGADRARGRAGRVTMPRYVALLRGVNDGGKNKVPMTELRALVESLGHSDVVTFIQSGNIVFT